MDMFGIGNAVRASLDILFVSARRTGRTTLLVENLKSGDRVITSTPQEARTLERLLKERGLEVEVEVIYVSPENFEDYAFRSANTLSGDGRAVLDHSMVEALYARGASRVDRMIAESEKRMSGYGAAHRETRRRAEEMSQWRHVWPKV